MNLLFNPIDTLSKLSLGRGRGGIVSGVMVGKSTLRERLFPTKNRFHSKSRQMHRNDRRCVPERGFPMAMLSAIVILRSRSRGLKLLGSRMT
ncbi:hypothetical protein I553_1782 [Mycobacterium xenopi 4042]|uniref:Uncharacterized protein n=1 Tax=Mycobacterium xenopi 4042 TaxID=1299334 RepID=X8DJK8_MYCXE|nr:hypothetical protein I553_1782 [Mycobacterium xenopi 4042]